jgi:hypothetical protein
VHRISPRSGSYPSPLNHSWHTSHTSGSELSRSREHSSHVHAHSSAATLQAGFTHVGVYPSWLGSGWLTGSPPTFRSVRSARGLLRYRRGWASLVGLLIILWPRTRLSRPRHSTIPLLPPTYRVHNEVRHYTLYTLPNLSLSLGHSDPQTLRRETSQTIQTRS